MNKGKPPTKNDGCVAGAPGHDARDVHGVDQGDETVAGQQAVGGLEGHGSTKSPWVTGGAASI